MYKPLPIPTASLAAIPNKPPPPGPILSKLPPPPPGPMLAKPLNLTILSCSGVMNVTGGMYTTVPSNGTEVDVMGIELRISLSLIMACVCTGSVFGEYIVH
eukprot:sb/3478507/